MAGEKKNFRWESYFGKWENYFGRCENYFGRWENYFGRRPNPKGRHVPSDDNDEDLRDDVHVNASMVMEGLTKSTLPFFRFLCFMDFCDGRLFLKSEPK